VATKHIISSNHSFDWANEIEILDYETNFRKRTISEIIHIKGQKNFINLMKDTKLLVKSYFNIFDDICEHSF